MSSSWWFLFNFLTTADFIVLPSLVALTALGSLALSIYFRFRPQHRWETLNPLYLAVGMIVGLFVGWLVIYLIANLIPAPASPDERTITPSIVLRTLLSSAILWCGVIFGGWFGVRVGNKFRVLKERANDGVAA